MTAIPIYDEIACSHRIRDQWRIHAVDDDYHRAVDRHVLVGGVDLRDFGFELKANSAGPLDLNSRQFQVQRATLREGVPPFVVQHTNPPEHPWCFRVWALRTDALRILDGRPWVTMSERQAEAFFCALCRGIEFTETHIATPERVELPQRNQWGGRCVECFRRVDPGDGFLFAKENGNPHRVEHARCRDARHTLQIKDFDPEAFALAGLHTDLVARQIWSPVALPNDYSIPPLRPVFEKAARRVLEAFNVFNQDDAPILPTSRPTVPVSARRRHEKEEEGQRRDEALARTAINLVASFFGTTYRTQLFAESPTFTTEPESDLGGIEYDCIGKARRFPIEAA